MRIIQCLAAVFILMHSSMCHAASIDKAKTLRSNGLLDQAKNELVEVVFDPEVTLDVKADALLLLGDIAVDEKKFDTAKKNWNRILADYSSTQAATLAREKLDLLDKLLAANAETRATPSPADQPAKSYPKGTILVSAPEKYQWAALQISGALGSGAIPFEGSLLNAVQLSKQQPEIVGIVEVTLDTDSLYESGRVTCYLSNGEKVWQEKTMFNMGGSEERIARRFVDKLAIKIKGRACP